MKVAQSSPLGPVLIETLGCQKTSEWKFSNWLTTEQRRKKNRQRHLWFKLVFQETKILMVVNIILELFANRFNHLIAMYKEGKSMHYQNSVQLITRRQNKDFYQTQCVFFSYYIYQYLYILQPFLGGCCIHFVCSQEASWLQTCF